MCAWLCACVQVKRRRFRPRDGFCSRFARFLHTICKKKRPFVPAVLGGRVRVPVPRSARRRNSDPFLGFVVGRDVLIPMLRPGVFFFFFPAGPGRGRSGEVRARATRPGEKKP